MRLRSEVLSVVQDDEGFTLELNGMTVGTKNWLSLPVGFRCRVWGNAFGYKIAEQFGLKVLPTRAGLVPFTLHKPLLEQLPGALWRVGLLRYHCRGWHRISRKSALYTPRTFGPSCFADFQFWQPGEFVSINLLPDVDLCELPRRTT